jgi:hypothetical protein
MKQVVLTTAEFYMFKLIANFMYEFAVSDSHVVINAEITALENLGY